MKNVSQLQPMVLAVSGALALMAGAVAAQTFDPNSAAVRQAYVGAATQEKKDAALAGLGLLVNQVRQSVPPSSQSGTLNISSNRFNVGGGTFSGGASVNISTGSGFFGNGSASGYIVIAGDVNNAFNLKFFSPTPLSLANIQASNDSDLGAPGTAVPLNGNTLQTLASFNTARNFTIDTLGGTIDTQGFDFGISGRIDANGKLTKLGSGTLTLTGNNVWNANIVNLRGVIEGNTNGLQTSIVNNGTVRFNQSQDGIYSGIISSGDRGYFEKTGAGKLTLTATQTYYNGITTILGGTLALSDSGALPLVYSPALHISSGATFDISGSSVKSHFLGAISGGGNIILGANSLSTGSQLSTNAFSDTTFSGSISGLGSFTKAGGGTLTLTGVNSYSGNTNIFDSKLSLSGEGRLNSASVVQMTRGTFDISSANGRREAGSLGGSGNANLGANTLTVGNASSDDRFEGSISGSGGLTKTGTGTLTLIGANTYSGITTINQGTLAAHAQSISNRVVNNGTLNFVSLSTDGFSLAYGGAISGTGSVNKSFGTLTLTGVNSYTGTTTVNDGWLALAGQGRLNAASSLVVANGTFDTNTTPWRIEGTHIRSGRTAGASERITGAGSLKLICWNGSGIFFRHIGLRLCKGVIDCFPSSSANRRQTISSAVSLSGNCKGLLIIFLHPLF